MRWIAIASLLCAAGPAFADEQPHGYPKVSAAASLLRRSEGTGMDIELALGGGRFATFLDGALSSAERRAGGGIRWLARAFEVGDGGAVELHLEGVAAYVQRLGDMQDPYAEVGFGVGWQIRAFDPRVALRITARAMFAQHDQGVPGLVALVGLAW